jgi:uncharacterized protein YuzE
MILKYSETADALYIYLQPGVSPTMGEEVDSGTIVDLDEEGRVVGIEVLNPARDWPLAVIAAQYPLELEDALQLQTLWGQNRPFPYARIPAAPKALTSVCG